MAVRDHDMLRVLLRPYVEGQLGDELAAEVRAHVATCPACEAAVMSLGTPPTPTPPQEPGPGPVEVAAEDLTGPDLWRDLGRDTADGGDTADRGDTAVGGDTAPPADAAGDPTEAPAWEPLDLAAAARGVGHDPDRADDVVDDDGSIDVGGSPDEGGWLDDGRRADAPEPADGGWPVALGAEPGEAWSDWEQPAERHDGGADDAEGDDVPAVASSDTAAPVDEHAWPPEDQWPGATGVAVADEADAVGPGPDDEQDGGAAWEPHAPTAAVPADDAEEGEPAWDPPAAPGAWADLTAAGPDASIWDELQATPDADRSEAPTGWDAVEGGVEGEPAWGEGAPAAAGEGWESGAGWVADEGALEGEPAWGEGAPAAADEGWESGAGWDAAEGGVEDESAWGEVAPAEAGEGWESGAGWVGGQAAAAGESAWDDVVPGAAGDDWESPAGWDTGEGGVDQGSEADAGWESPVGWDTDHAAVAGEVGWDDVDGAAGEGWESPAGWDTVEGGVDQGSEADAGWASPVGWDADHAGAAGEVGWDDASAGAEEGEAVGWGPEPIHGDSEGAHWDAGDLGGAGAQPLPLEQAPLDDLAAPLALPPVAATSLSRRERRLAHQARRRAEPITDARAALAHPMLHRALAALIALCLAVGIPSAVVGRTDDLASGDPLRFTGAPDGVDIDGVVVERAWGIEVRVAVEGLDPGERFFVDVEDVVGEAVAAGTFLAPVRGTAHLRFTVAVPRARAATLFITADDAAPAMSAPIP